jgi:hypothetical protein
MRGLEFRAKGLEIRVSVSASRVKSSGVRAEG